jgi:hypothetical protein
VAAGIASQVSCLATLDELALAARDPSKKVHRCILIGHSFGGLLLGNTISHSIFDASGPGELRSRERAGWSKPGKANLDQLGKISGLICRLSLCNAFFVIKCRLRTAAPKTDLENTSRGLRSLA